MVKKLNSGYLIHKFANLIMQVFHTESKIIITCNKRLSPYLQTEVEELGFKPVRVFQTGVELIGTVNDCYRA